MPGTAQLETITKVELVWRCFYQRQCLSLPTFMRESDFTTFLPQQFAGMVMQIKTMVAGERVHEIKYPLDWWQATRERWFPKFWLKWFPVRYHEWHVDFLYPLVERRKTKQYGLPEIAIYSSAKPTSPGFLPHPEEDRG